MKSNGPALPGVGIYILAELITVFNTSSCAQLPNGVSATVFIAKPSPLIAYAIPNIQGIAIKNKFLGDFTIV
jgi:hypothetical protein